MGIIKKQIDLAKMFTLKNFLVALILVIGVIVCYILRMNAVNSHIPQIESNLKNSAFTYYSKTNGGDVLSDSIWEFSSNGTAKNTRTPHYKSKYGSQYDEPRVSGPFEYSIRGTVFGKYEISFYYLDTDQYHNKGDFYGKHILVVNSDYEVTSLDGTGTIDYHRLK